MGPEPDPRLVALGLESPHHPPEPPPEDELTTDRSTAEDDLRLEAVVEAVPTGQIPQAYPVAALSRESIADDGVVLFRQPVVLRTLRPSRAVLELLPAGLRLSGKRPLSLPWSEVRGLERRRGALRIADGRRWLDLVADLDGVAEPALSEGLAAIIAETSCGAPALPGTLRAFQQMTDELRRRFREQDDPLVPLLLIIAAGSATVLLALLLPLAVLAPFRGGQVLPPGSFLIYPRITHADPRVLAAALAGGTALGALLLRVAVGGVQWARGTLRGWSGRAFLPVALVRRAAAGVLLRPRLFAAAFLVAIGLLVPTGRERTLVDEQGVHIRAGLPLFDRDEPWSALLEAVEVEVGAEESSERRAVIIRFRDGTALTTRGQDVFGLSQYALYRFASERIASRP